MNRLTGLIIFFCVAVSLPLHAKVYGDGEVYRLIMNRKEIRIGISRNYPPLNFESGTRGLEIDMIQKLQDFLGVKARLVPLELQQYIPSLKSGKVDIIVAGYSRNMRRGKEIWFSEPYLTVTPGVLVNKQVLPQTDFGEEFEKAPVKTLWDLKRINQFKIAVKAGSTYELLLKELFPNMIRTEITTNEEGLELLDNGQVQGFVHDSIYLNYLYSNNIRLRNSYQLLKGGRLTGQLCIGLPFGDSIFKNQINLFILELKRLGIISGWLKNYNID